MIATLFPSATKDLAKSTARRTFALLTSYAEQSGDSSISAWSGGNSISIRRNPSSIAALAADCADEMHCAKVAGTESSSTAVSGTWLANRRPARDLALDAMETKAVPEWEVRVRIMKHSVLSRVLRIPNERFRGRDEVPRRSSRISPRLGRSRIKKPKSESLHSPRLNQGPR